MAEQDDGRTEILPDGGTPPPQPGHIPSDAVTGTAPEMEKSPRALMWAVLALIALLFVWLSFGGRAPSHDALNLAAEAPEGTVLLAAVRHPEATFGEAIKAFKESSPENRTLMKDAVLSARHVLGFDFDDAEAFAKAGFDISAPMTMALLELDRYGDPKGIVLSLGVSDRDAVLKTLKDIAKNLGGEPAEDKEAEPTVHLVRGGGKIDFDTGAVVTRNRIYLALGDDNLNKAEALRTFLKDSEEKPIRKTARFRDAVAELDWAGEMSGYVDLADILSRLPKRDRPAIADEFLAVAFATTDAGGSLALLLSKESGLKDYLEPGASCRDFIRKADKPLAAFAVSIRDPEGLVTYIIEHTVPEDQKDMIKKSIDRDMKRNFNTSLKELCALFKDGVGGMMFYSLPQGGFGTPVNALAFQKVNDRDKGLALIQKSKVANFLQRKDYGDNVVYSQRGGFIAVAIGLVDDYIVIGTAVNEIENLAAGKAKGWSPKCGGKGLASGEAFVGELLTALEKELPREALPMVKEFFDKDDHVSVTVERRGRSLVCTTESKFKNRVTGLVPLAGIVPAVVVPNVMESSLTTNEAAAAKMLAVYATEQEHFWENDYDGDGIANYAVGLASFAGLVDAGGGTIDALPPDFINATSPATAYKGYYYVDIVDWQASRQGYGLCAVPAEYGSTGRKIFIINKMARIYWQDFGAITEITNWPADPAGAGWVAK